MVPSASVEPADENPNEAGALLEAGGVTEMAAVGDALSPGPTRMVTLAVPVAPPLSVTVSVATNVPGVV